VERDKSLSYYHSPNNLKLVKNQACTRIP